MLLCLEIAKYSVTSLLYQQLSPRHCQCNSWMINVSFEQHSKKKRREILQSSGRNAKKRQCKQTQQTKLCLEATGYTGGCEHGIRVWITSIHRELGVSVHAKMVGDLTESIICGVHSGTFMLSGGGEAIRIRENDQ